MIVAIGGTFFIRAVLAPAAKRGLSEEAHAGLAPILMQRWARVVHVCILTLILSGTYNTIVQFPRHAGQPLYHALWGIKVLLAMAVFFVATAITGKSPAFEGLRRRRMMWMAVNVALAGAIVLISNVLKSLPAAQ